MKSPLIEPSLFYDPPYERPLEDEFAWHLIKYLRPITGLRYQVKVETPCANAWVDFIVERGAIQEFICSKCHRISPSDHCPTCHCNAVRRTRKLIVGFEIGSLEDESDAEQERYRDALVIGSGALDVLYRFRAADLLYRPHDALYITSLWDPHLFKEAGKISLKTLASDEARCAPLPQIPRAHSRVIYAADENYGAPAQMIVKRLDRSYPIGWLRNYDQALKSCPNQ